MKPVAILSTTVVPKDGMYAVVGTQTLGPLREGDMVDVGLALLCDMGRHVEVSFAGIPHFIGHPATRSLVEEAGAFRAEAELFAGLEVGESALCVPIVQGQSDRAKGGNAIHQDVDWSLLEVRIMQRLA